MSSSTSDALQTELETKREQFLQAMLRATVPLEGVSEADRRQFVAGYLDLIVHAAHGDLGPRDAYLEGVIPGIKGAGMPFDYVLSAMAGVAMAVASVAAPEHLAWHVEFTRDYVALLARQWARS